MSPKAQYHESLLEAAHAKSALQTIEYEKYVNHSPDLLLFGKYPFYTFEEVRTSSATERATDQALNSNMHEAVCPADVITLNDPTQSARALVGLMIATAFHSFGQERAGVIDAEMATQSEAELQKTERAIHLFGKRIAPNSVSLLVVDASSFSQDTYDRKICDLTTILEKEGTLCSNLLRVATIVPKNVSEGAHPIDIAPIPEEPATREAARSYKPLRLTSSAVYLKTAQSISGCPQ